MNARFTTLPAIPWVHQAGDLASVWKWETPHFVVTVTGDVRSVYYQIADKSKGRPVPFADGQAATFDDAEHSVRETIGKAYPEALGYRAYAGHLATTFLLGNSQRIDLGVYVGKLVSVTVLDDQLQPVRYTGYATIEHYDLLLTNNDTITRISPSEITEIGVLTNFGATRPLDHGPAKKASRTVHGEKVRGCTGVPGFLPDTVDHTGPACPIHEESRRL